MLLQMLGMSGVASYAAARWAGQSNLLRFQRSVLFALPTDSLPPMPRGYQIEPISPAQLANLPADTLLGNSDARLAHGATCLAARTDKGVVAGTIWLACDSIVEGDPSARFILPRHVAWDTGVCIAPEYRMTRTFQALWAGAGNWLRERDLRWSASLIADYNWGSLNAHRRLGGRAMGHVIGAGIGPWNALKVQGQPLRFGRTGQPFDVDVPHPD